MTVLGLDPGLARLGWGIVREERGQYSALGYGVIETKAGDPTPTRLTELYNGVRDIITLYKPDEIAIEELFFSKNVTTGIAVGEARGVVVLACAQWTVDLAQYTPMRVKQAVTGYGKADKQQVTHMVQLLLHLAAPPKPDDAADALAVALCHVNTRKVVGFSKNAL